MSIQLLFSFQVRLSILRNSASVVDAQQVFKCTFKAFRNENYLTDVDIKNYQSIFY